MNDRRDRMITDAMIVVTSTNGRTRFAAAINAAREANKARAENNTNSWEYHVVRKMWFTGKLTAEGLRNFCTDLVDKLIAR